MNNLKFAVIGVLAAVVGLVGYGLSQGDAAQAATRECGPNAIITCGALSEDELAKVYAKNDKGDLDNIFSAYGITSSMLKSHAGKKGYVTKSGDVVVDGKTVATNAYSLGRTKLHGGTTKTIDGKKYYEGPTSQRFSSSKLDAFVFFDKDGRFIAAILLVCGNPVRATPPAPKPKPVYSCDLLKADEISSTRHEYKFTTKYTAEKGAKVTNFIYDFGDGNSSAGDATINHTYTKPGTYTASVKLTVSVDGKTKTVEDSKCKVVITIKPDNCPIPGKKHLPKDSPECKEDKPAIEVIKKVNGEEHAKVAVGETFNYEITVANKGNVALKNVKVTDVAPSQVQLLPGANVSGNTWTTTIAELGVDESQTFSVPAKYVKYISGTHPNNVCVDTPTIPGSPDDCDEATTETTEKVKACNTDTKTVEYVERGKENTPPHTTDFSKCEEEKTPPPTPETPETPAAPEALPTTGPEELLNGVLGAGSLVGAGLYYIASRRSL